MVLGLNVAVKYLNDKLLIFFLLLGCSTILLDSLFFRFNDVYSRGGDIFEYGRYSGFYLNPNVAAFLCLIGYIISLVKIKKNTLLLSLFTLFGIMTLSRTFVLSWIIVNFIYLRFNRKHIIWTIVLLLALPFSFVFLELLQLEASRFQSLVDILTSLIS